VFVQMNSINSTWLRTLGGAAIALAAATSNATAADPTPAALQAAQTIVASSGMTTSFDQVVPQMLYELERTTTATRPDIKDSLHATLLELAPEFAKSESEVIQSAALSLASHMNEQELKDTAAFFQSASGKKYVEIQPAMYKDIVSTMQNWRQKLSTQMLIRTREEMRKKGVELQ
jgi:uncharacterized protein